MDSDRENSGPSLLSFFFFLFSSIMGSTNQSLSIVEPTNLSDLSFSSSPLAHFHKIQAKNPKLAVDIVIDPKTCCGAHFRFWILPKIFPSGRPSQRTLCLKFESIPTSFEGVSRFFSVLTVLSFYG